jgi:hypothetical protein
VTAVPYRVYPLRDSVVPRFLNQYCRRTASRESAGVGTTIAHHNGEPEHRVRPNRLIRGKLKGRPHNGPSPRGAKRLSLHMTLLFGSVAITVIDMTIPKHTTVLEVPGKS